MEGQVLSGSVKMTSCAMFQKYSEYGKLFACLLSRASLRQKCRKNRRLLSVHARGFVCPCLEKLLRVPIHPWINGFDWGVTSGLHHGNLRKNMQNEREER